VTHRFFPSTAIALGTSIAGALIGVSSANAGAFTAEYVFGDSLSDTGNLAELLNVANFAAHGFYFGNFPNPPSYHDSQTNGPVAVQGLAQSLGLNANPSLWVTNFTDPAGLFGGPSFVPGTNYAVAGATASPTATNGTPTTSLPNQVGAFSLHEGGAADPNALYVVMIGGNDARDAALYDTGLAATDAITTGVGWELTEISKLSGEGAKNFLIVNVPNVGLIPEFAQDHPGDAGNATAYSISYDNQLYAGLKGLGLPKGDRLFDLYALNANILKNAASYGFTNTTDRCFTNAPFTASTTPQCGLDGANIASFVYWDSVHPTARVQALWAEGFLAAVPEPSTWAMILLGFAGLGYAGRRKAKTSPALSA
jgi:phospholipase/lecithinase/hemolysin